MLQVLARAPRAAVSRDERRRGEEHLLHGLSQRVSRSFQWGRRNDWQRGLLQHATNVGHRMFAALVHTPCSQHRYVSQSASNGLCMYSMEYLSDRVKVRAAGDLSFTIHEEKSTYVAVISRRGSHLRARQSYQGVSVISGRGSHLSTTVAVISSAWQLSLGSPLGSPSVTVVVGGGDGGAVPVAVE